MSTMATGGSSSQQTNIDRQRQMATLNELQTIKDKFEQEMNLLTESVQKLQAIQQHFLASQETTKQLESLGDRSDILVPLCDGLFVRGKALETQTSLVEIGAGYFVEMNHEQCRDYFKRRIEFLNTQLTNLQKMGQEKLQSRQYIIDAMQKQMASMKLGMSRNQPGR